MGAHGGTWGHTGSRWITWGSRKAVAADLVAWGHMDMGSHGVAWGHIGSHWVTWGPREAVAADLIARVAHEVLGHQDDQHVLLLAAAREQRVRLGVVREERLAEQRQDDL
eukprot:6810958-Prymnesium_polylepis.1